jgi:hypothetical protein
MTWTGLKVNQVLQARTPVCRDRDGGSGKPQAGEVKLFRIKAKGTEEADPEYSSTSGIGSA